MVENFKISETNYCGKCPECNSDWDMGEVIDVVRDGLLNHDYYKKNPDKLEKIEDIARYAVTGDRTDKYKLLIAESEAMKKAIDKMHADREARLSNS